MLQAVFPFVCPQTGYQCHSSTRPRSALSSAFTRLLSLARCWSLSLAAGLAPDPVLFTLLAPAPICTALGRYSHSRSLPLPRPSSSCSLIAIVATCPTSELLVCVSLYLDSCPMPCNLSFCPTAACYILSKPHFLAVPRFLQRFNPSTIFRIS